jgi:hypothetical protein
MHQHRMPSRRERPHSVADAASKPAETACFWHR